MDTLLLVYVNQNPPKLVLHPPNGNGSSNISQQFNKFKYSSFSIPPKNNNLSKLFPK